MVHNEIVNKMSEACISVAVSMIELGDLIEIMVNTETSRSVMHDIKSQSLEKQRQ